MIRRPPRSTQSRSSAASDVYKRQAVNSVRSHRGLPELGAVEFLGLAKEHMARLAMDPAFLSRSVNAGFSGGEKKRNEILQMSMLEPRLAILDETDSGLLSLIH